MAKNKNNPTGFNLAGKGGRFGFRTVPNESVAWRLQSSDGTYFGDVSYGAYKAVENGTLDSYQPKNEEEKAILSEFRKSPTIPLMSTDGTDFGSISYDAYNAFRNNKIESYKPYNDEEAKIIGNFKSHAETIARDERINSNPVFARYGIDPADFGHQDFINWLENNNMQVTGGDNSGLEYGPVRDGWLGIFGKSLATKQQIEDADVLYQLQANNYRRDLSQGDQGGFWAFVGGVSDGMYFGGLRKLGEHVIKKNYENVGLDPDSYISPTQAWGKTKADNPLLYFSGDIFSSVVSLGMLSKGVGAATKGVKWISKSPSWVQSAINSGITFSIASGTETAFEGGDLKDVLVSAGTNFVGGAVGGAISNKVGAIGEKLLFNKGWQHKIIPEMIRNGFASASFAGGKVASTYFLYPEEYRPTAEEITRDLGIAFAFGAVSSGINTIKTSAQNKKYLDDLYQRMASDYEKMARTNISNKGDVLGIRKFAKNVIGYSNAMEAYLTGKEYNATIDGKTYTFTPNKIRLVGQDKYVRTILSEIQTIRNNANAIISGVGSPTTDVATTTHTSGSTVTPPVIPTISNTKSSVTEVAMTLPENGTVSLVREPTTYAGVGVKPSSIPSSKSGELTEIMESGTIAKFAPDYASGEIKKLENILIAKGADNASRQEIISVALEVEKALDGSNKTIRSVFNNVSKITSNAIAEIKNEAGVSNSYWTLFGENFKAIPKGNVSNNIELIVEYSKAFTGALKNNNLDKYNDVVVSVDGDDLSAELPQTIMRNTIPEKVKNAGAYRLLATRVKNIISNVDAQIANERSEIYGSEDNVVQNDSLSPGNQASKTDAVTFIPKGDMFNVYGADAELLNEKFNIKTTPIELDGKTVPYIGVSEEVLGAIKKELGKLGLSVNVSSETVSQDTENAPVSAETTDAEKDIPDAFKRGEDGNLRFTQLDIDYSNTTMRKGQFKTIGVGWKTEIVDGHMRGKYGIHKNDSGKYAVTMLQSGMMINSFDTLTEAKSVAVYLDENLAFNDISFSKGLSGAIYLNKTDETNAYILEAKRIIDSKEYSKEVSSEIQDGKVPFSTKKGLVDYVKNHIGNKVRITFGDGSSEVRTVESVSNNSLKTKSSDGSTNVAELKGLNYNDAGFSIDYDTGVSAIYDFVNVEDTPGMNGVSETDIESSTDEAFEDTAKMYRIMDELGLTYDEQNGIMQYKSRDSYTLNEALRNGRELNENQKFIKNGLNSALEKFPAYAGVVYRNIGFVTKGQFEDFIAEHSSKNIITYTAFTSASKAVDGYVVEAPYIVHYEIDSTNGRDVSRIGIEAEKEILFATDTTFEFSIVEQSNNYLHIKMKEIIEDGKSKSNELLEDGGKQRTVQNDGAGTEPVRTNKEVYSSPDAIRGRSSTHDDLYQGTSGGNSRGTGKRSQSQDVGNDSEVGNDSNREGPLSRINSISAIVKSSLKPEILSNEELMNMLSERFGSDGLDGLIAEIVSRYENGESIGEFEGLFKDNGKELYDALNRYDESGTPHQSPAVTHSLQGEDSVSVVPGIRKGTVAAKEFQRRRPKFFNVVDGIAKKLGIEVVIDEEIDGADGYYDPKTKELHISLNAENPVKVIVRHEITHVLEGTKAYDELISFMKEYFPSKWNAKRKAIKEKYDRINKYNKEHGKELIDTSDAAIDYETMAEFAEKMNVDSYIKKVAKEKPGLINTVRKFMSEIKERIGKFLPKKELTKWEQAEAKWKKALDEAVESGVMESEGDVKYKKNDNVGETSSVKEQMRTYKDELNSMDAVATINSDKNFSNAKEAVRWAIETLKQSGYRAERKDFGSVIFDEKRLTNGARYLKTNEDYVAYALIPKIVKRGIEVGEHENHKNRGYETTTFAAPVEINGSRYNMAVVVRKENKNYYKLHRVIMPDGGVFEFNEKSSAERAAATTSVVDTPTSTTSTNSISNPAEKVKENSEITKIPEGAKPKLKDIPGIVDITTEAVESGTINTEGNIEYSTKNTNINKVKYSPKGIKLSAQEKAKFISSVGTDYYKSYKTHEGLQYQSCVFDDKHILYIYEDGGFGNYNVVGRINFENEEMANAVIEEVRNATTYRVTDVVNKVLQTFKIRRSGYTVHNAYTGKRSSSRGDDTVFERKSQSDSRGVDSDSGRTSGNKRKTESERRYKLKDITDIVENSTNPDAEFWNEWLNKAKEYGVIPKGENPVRDVDVPRKISEKDVVSRFARTLIEAGVTPEENVSDFEKAILAGEMTHEVIGNKKAQDYAKERIKYLGFEEALKHWTVLSESGKIGKKELALGMELYNQCITNKDVRNAMKIAAELTAEATRAGQTLQACRMLKFMTPDGQLYYLEKSIQKMNDEFKERLGEKYKDIELDEELMREFLEEKDEAKRNVVYDKLCQNIADQIPATKRDKWNAWRYLAMLGNPRTHIRNIVGNAIFIPSVRIKNYIGAVIERTVGIEAEKRTRSLHKNKEAVEFAKKDFEVMKKTLQGENAKYAVTSDIESKRTIFNTKWLEKLRLKNFDFLEKEDMWFLKKHYVDALARLMTVRNIDVDSVSPRTLDTLRAFAVKEAQAATYRDANSLADGLNKLQRNLERSDNKAVRATSILLEGVMPFKKTPMNIAKQGINYSPVGLLKGAYKALKKLNNGSTTTDEVIDDFAKGLTGIGVMLLGFWLASRGSIIGAGDKPEKEKEFEKMVGEQSYAIKIKDGFTYTIDWMTPSNLSLFIGAKLYDLTKDEFSFADVVDALSTITEPLLELSVFSGVNGVIESAQYSDSEAILAIGSDMITSYILQALPTIGGQLVRMLDDNKREYYYVDKNSDVPRGLQRFIGQASSKIPFASYLFEPAIDEWGREEKYGNVIERAFENTISPGYYAEDNYTEVDKELKDLYERTGESSVLPVTQQKYYKKDKIYYYMSAKDYTEVKKIRGQKSFKYVETLIHSSDYKGMSDEEKVKAIKKCYEKAGDETKEAMFEKVKNNSK